MSMIADSVAASLGCGLVRPTTRQDEEDDHPNGRSSGSSSSRPVVAVGDPSSLYLSDSRQYNHSRGGPYDDAAATTTQEAPYSVQHLQHQSTSTLLLLSAGQFNRLGVTALSGGDIPAALTWFQMALDKLELANAASTTSSSNSHQFFPQCQQLQHCSSSTNNNNDLDEFGSHYRTTTNTVPPPPPQLRQEPRRVAVECVCLPHLLQDDYLFIYNYALDFLCDVQTHRAVVIPGGEQQQQQQQQQQLPNKNNETITTACGSTNNNNNNHHQIPFYRAIVMLNSALSLHQRGFMFHDDATLLRALYVYDESIRILKNEIPSFCSSDYILFLMLAVWNNQSHIYYDLQSYEYAKVVLEGVRKLSVRLLLGARQQQQIIITNNNNNNNTSSASAATPPMLDDVDQGHIREFLYNVIVMQEPISAPCA